ncbi:bifunctional 3'-5' exonuclease/ATP-dependent helicase WRN isoform X3 [Ascaphus truei]|uniref:bifunctional 3'-5' exonuclease/ATP-dependent helicase WRN isoform X3 n=1 Tax=Ascaphus truei TaxID=8439 RepID=UPI003F5A772B
MANQQRQLPQWMSANDQEIISDDKKKSLIKNVLEDDLPFLEFNGSVVYSYQANDCSLLAEDIRASLSEGAVLGFDIEWPPVYTKGKTGKVALIQVCVSEKKCYLFHISAMSGFPKGLKRLLEDESIRKVGVGIEGDQWKLMSDCDLKLKQFIELTEVANQKLKCKEKWSLNGLIKHLFKKQILKDDSIRCSNWDAFPLNEDQKLYAASDAYAGLLIYQKLESMDDSERALCRKGMKVEPNEVKRQLSTLSQGLLDLVDQVPNNLEHLQESQRAADILTDLSEKLEVLRNILLEASKGEEISGFVCDRSSDCSEQHRTTMDHAKPEPSAEEVPSGSRGDHLNLKQDREDKEAGGTEAKENRDQDFFMTLGISEDELDMMEQKGTWDQKSETGYKSNEDLIGMDDETDLSYVIESDDELETEMLRSLEHLDNSPELDVGTMSLQRGLASGGKELAIAVDEDEDEGIEEEDEDDWDPSVPQPNADQVACLKTYFGHSSFKPVQWKVIYSILKERRDNLVVMATGYGKSLCYQFAPVYTSGIGIVISPLISLMEDQVLQLEMSNIPSCFLGSAQSKNVMKDVKAGKLKVIYMTPEFCSGGISLLQDLDDKYGITLIAIDEAHCISEWGHDFRSAYRNLGSLKRMLPSVPIVALTATASPSIREDIAKSLSLHNPQVTCTSFDRPNLYLEVGRKTSNTSKDLQQFLIKKQGSGWEFEGATIIYCPTRKSSELVTAELVKLGIVCGTYHAGMAIKARREVHHRFMRDEIQCVVATVAFGMGINKADIRKVIHYGAPKEMESYYQEIGRAGRDALPSSCHALWTHADMNFSRHMLSEIKTKSFREYKLKMMAKMEKYLNSSTCRRKIILSHFEDKQLRKASSGIMGTEKCCDNCKNRLIHNIAINDAEDSLQDFGRQAYQLMSAVEALGEKFGTGVPVLFLRGSNSQRLPDRYRCHPLFSKGKDQTEVFWKALARQLITEGFLSESSGRNKFATTCGLTAKARKWVSKASDESCRTLLLQPNDELCPRKTFPSLRAPSLGDGQPSPNVRSSKLIPDIQKTSLRDTFSYQEADKISKTTEVSTSSLKLPSPRKVTKPPEPTVSPRDLELQTALYGKLVASRQKLASEKDVPPAVLATNKILVDMAKIRPTTIENMKKVDGVSDAKSSMLAPLLGVIKEFCLANSLQEGLFSNPGPNLQPNVEIQQSSVCSALPESQRVTYSLFQEQYLSLLKIANTRSLSLPAVGMHLCQALKAGYPLDVQRAGLTPTVRKIITDVIKKPPINSDLTSFKAIRELVPPDIDIYLIRMAIALIQKDSSSETLSQQVGSSNKALPSPALHLKIEPQEKTKHKVHIDNSLWIENESYATTPKRKLPEWFGAPKGNPTSANATKKSKTGTKKGLFG